MPSDSVVDVVLSARSRAAITLGITDDGEQIVSAIDGADAAAHLCVGDVVLAVNGREPSLANGWQRETTPVHASVLTLRVRRHKEGGGDVVGEYYSAAAHHSISASFGGYGLTPGLYSMPVNLLPLPNGELLVADGGGCRLQRVSHAGDLRDVLGSLGDQLGELNYPAGLALADDDTAIIVADRGNCRLQKLRLSDGTPLAATPPTAESDEDDEGEGEAPEELLNYPWGLCNDSDGHRVITADMRGRIYIFDLDRLKLLCSHTPRDPPGSPHGMAVWKSEVFLADHDNHRVMALALRDDTPPGATGAPAHFGGGERSIGCRGCAPGQFEHPIGLAILQDSGTLLVSEFTGRRVQALDASNGAPLFVLPAPANTRLLGLCVIGTANEHRIFVGDFDLDRVHCWECVPAGRSRRGSRDAYAPSAAMPMAAAVEEEENVVMLEGEEEPPAVVVDASGADFSLEFGMV